jgi:hypothetical protein
MVEKDVEVAEVVEEDDDVDHPEDDTEDEYQEGGWSFRRKFFVVLTIIIIIIAASASIVLFNPSVKEVLIVPTQEMDDRSGIIVEAYATREGTSGVTDTGKIQILYGGVEQYSSSFEFNNDYGRKEIKYKDFVWDKGEYEIVVSYGDKSTSDFFNLESEFDFGIAEYVNVTLELVPNESQLKGPTNRTGAIRIHAIAIIKELVTSGNTQYEKNPTATPSNATIDLTIEHESGTDDSDSKNIRHSASALFNKFIYYSDGSGPGPGLYSVSVKITNHNVKPDSPKYQITLPDVVKNHFLNVAPIADGGDDKNENAFGQNSKEVSFDASASWNDGEITKYIWDLDYDLDTGFDPKEETTTPTVSYIYTKQNDQTPNSDTFYVHLMVVGDTRDSRFGYENGDVKYEFSEIDEVVVTIRWGFI